MKTSGTVLRAASVSMGPGAMALTRMFMPPISAASWAVSELIPALERP
jgi:hypothetical protein